MNRYHLLVWLALLLTLVSLPVLAQGVDQPEVNPRSEYWREVRQGLEGYTAVKGQETDVLIQTQGHNWRQLRNGPVANYGGWFLGAVVLALGVFYLIRGQVKLEHGRAGMRMLRWRIWERVLHWTVAVLFITLSVTGLSLLFGRAVLIPLIGHEAFAVWAALAKLLHNYAGPVFMAGVLIEVMAWIRYNFIKQHDITWFKQGGGIVGHGHPPAGRMNGGEKTWFWAVFLLGLGVVGISGVILNFPNLGLDRQTMQDANLVHAIGAFAFMAMAMGHIYIGTLGSEGSLEAMTTGYVDVNWAKQHHDLWFDEEMNKGAGIQPATQGEQPTASAPTALEQPGPG